MSDPIYLGTVDVCTRCWCQIQPGHNHNDPRVCLQDFLAAVSA